MTDRVGRRIAWSPRRTPSEQLLEIVRVSAGDDSVRRRRATRDEVVEQFDVVPLGTGVEGLTAAAAVAGEGGARVAVFAEASAIRLWDRAHVGDAKRWRYRPSSSAWQVACRSERGASIVARMTSLRILM